MARINKGILGGFSGKVGPVVGVNWRGTTILRSMPQPSQRPPSEKQVLQRAKFKVASHFIKPLREVQRLYFGEGIDDKARLNAAMSYTVLHAVEVVEGIPEMVLSRVLITKGELLGVMDLQISRESATRLVFRWKDTAAQANASTTDYLNVVYYSAASERFEIHSEGMMRGDGYAEILLPEDDRKTGLDIWVFASTMDRKIASTSAYMGHFEGESLGA